MISRILIANRGEIALRIIRTCREQDIECVAVYSEADRDALHVQLADQAVCIGPAPAKDSYLNMNAILQAALQTGCDAVHPGFGFLSENPDFCRLCKACGLIFIGPCAEAMDRLAGKDSAKAMLASAGIPVIPGTDYPLASADECLKEAEKTGYPVMLKACAGGGGKGMRIVRAPEEMESAFSACRQEAGACFNDQSILLEKYVEHAKHVEIQVACDQHGNGVHLFERDCSFQIGRQKMIEEAPCAVLDEALRQEMADAALKICRETGYDSLGTVEFLLDADRNFYFMEMNTRIQVEHPVTEAITGLDLIALQIEIAQGKPLGLHQEDIRCAGHALECRINAQNPAANLAPAAGTISFLHLPGGPHVRVDDALYAGCRILPYYDSNICKLIVSGKDRSECLRRMKRALEETIVEGVQTNTDFAYLVLHEPAFESGSYDTAFGGGCLERMNRHDLL